MGRKEERLEQIKKQAAEREKIEARLKAAKEKRITEGQNKSYVRAGGEAFPTFEELRNNRNREQADRFSEKNKEMISGIWKNPAMTTAEKQIAAAELNIKGTENYKRIARGEKKSLSSKIMHPGEAPEALEAVRTPDGDIKITSSPKDIHNAARYNIAAEDYNAAVERHNNEIKRQQEEERARRREYKRTYPYVGKSFDELTGMYNATRSEKEKAEINSWRIQAANQNEAYKMRADAEKEYERYNSEYDKYRGMSTAVGLSPDKIEEFEKKRDEFKSQADYYKGVMDQLDERIGDLASKSAMRVYGSIAEESGDDGAYHQSVYFAERYDTETELPAIKEPDEEYLYNAINTIGRYKYDAENEDYVYSTGEYEFGSDYDKYKFMTDDERLTYNKLHNAGETDYEKEYLGALDKELTKRLNEKEARDAYEFGEEHPYLAGVATVATDIVVSPVATADNIIDELVAGSVDVNDGTSRQIRKAQNYRAGGRQHMVDNHGEWAGVAYDAGLELTNIAVTIALTKGVGSGATALGAGARTANTASRIASYSTMFGRSASYTMISAADRGASDREIIALGTATGLLEIATEALPFERFMNPKVTRGFVGYLVEGLKQVPGNAVEEIIAEAGGMALDALIMGEKSESRLEMQRLIVEEGLTAEEAAKVVALDNLQRLGSAGFMGGIVGFGAGTATSAAAGIGYNSHLNSFANDMIQSRPGAVEKLITFSAEIKSPAAVKAAEQIQKNGVNAKNVGDMIDSVIGQMLAGKGSKANIIRSMYILEGQDADFITSKEASAVADSIIRFAAGKATKADVAVLERSRSAAMVLDVLEANSDAKKAVASQMPEGVYRENNAQTKFKISENSKGKYVKADRQVIKGNNPKAWAEQVENYINESIRRNKDVMFAGADGDLFVITTDTAGKARFRNTIDVGNGKRRRMTDAEYAAKLRAETHIDELIQASKTGKSRSDTKDHSFAKDGFNYRKAFFEDFDGSYYEVTISVGKDGIVNTVYNVGRLDKKTNPSYSGSKTSQQRTDYEGFVKNRVSQNEGSVNTQSMQEGKIYSQGKRVNISKEEKRIGNVVQNEENRLFRDNNAKGYNVIERMARDLRKPVKFVRGLTNGKGESLDGLLTEDGIFINIEAENPTRFAATHEFSHQIKKNAPKEWARYQKYVINEFKNSIDVETGKSKYELAYEEKLENYAPEDIDEEIACDQIGKMFGDIDELAKFIKDNRGFAARIRDWWYDTLVKLKMIQEKRDAKELWARAYRKAMYKAKNDEAAGGIKYSKEYTFNKQVDDALDYKMKSGYSVYVGKLPKLLAKCGLNPQLEMLMNQGHLRDIEHKKDIKHREYHELPRELIKQLPELLKRPAAVYDSISEKNKENSVCVLTTKCDKDGNPIIVIIENSGRSSVYLNVKMETVKVDKSNYVDSMYGREGFFEHMKDVIEKDALLYSGKDGIEKLFAEMERVRQKNKNPKLNSVSKLELLTRLDNLGFDTIIHQSRNVVNTYSMQDGGNNTQKKSVTGTRLSGAEIENSVATETDRLAQENAELKKQLENIHIQLNQAEGRGPDVKEIKKAAQKIRTAYGSKIGVAELHRELTKLYTYMSGNNVNSDEVSKRISILAGKVIENATERIDIGSEYTDLLDRIRTTRIQVPESERADFKDGYEKFRKSNMGKLRLANDGIELDVLWDELCYEYPHFFSEDVTGVEERLERILEIREELRPVEESIFHSDEEFKAAQIALENDIMESFYNIPESDGNTKFIFYDKRAAVAEQKLREREAELYKNIEAMKKRHAAEIEKAQKFAARQQRLRGRDKIKRKIDSDYNYISRMVKNPTDARHVPEEMRAGVSYLLDCFNFETVQLDKIKDAGKEANSPTAVKLAEMHKAYLDIMRKAWGVDSSNAESNLLDEQLTKDLQELRDEIPIDESGEFKRIQDMSVEELRTVSKVLTGIHHVITTKNKAFNGAIKDGISDLGEKSIADMRDTRGLRRGSGEKTDYEETALEKAIKLADNYFNFDNVQPWDFFHGIGGTMEKLYGEERRGFDRHIRNIKEAAERLKKATEGINLKKLTGKSAEKTWFKLESGEEIRLSKGQVLSLYALYQRNQGKEHILGGGIVTNSQARNEQGNKASANSVHGVTETDLGKMFEMLSQEEKNMVSDIVDFLSKRCSKWGNETSMKLYGYEKYGEGWYFPIKVSTQTLATYYGEKGEGNLRSQGFTKQLVKKAKNAIEIGDFFDIITSHINGMSLYNTVAIPMLDLERVLNYTESGTDTKVRQEIVKTFGKSAEKYIEAFHKDINGSRKIAEKDPLLEKMAANAKRASIGLNLRVLLQQPTSIARVLLFMNPRDIPAVWNGVTLKKEMQENIPIAYWKSLGFRDIGVGSTMKEVLLDNESLYNKAAMGGYGMADDFTWTLIYGAVKNEIARKNPSLDKNGTQFMDKVRERFNYIVDRSQVVDSVFHRTQIMRSGNMYTKTATMFMSEPLKTYNMYRTEMLDAMKNGEFGKKAARATAVFVVSNLLLSIAQALPDTWREDDDKELFKDGKEIPLWDRYFKKFQENMTDNSNPLTYFPYIKDIWSMIQGYSQERIEYSNLADLIANTKGLRDGKRTTIHKLIGLAKPASAVFGISAGNLFRDTKALAETVYRMTGDEYADYMIDKFSYNVKNASNKSRFMKHYKRAVQNGHSEDAATILADYMAETFKGHDFKHSHAEDVITEMSKLYGKTDDDSKLFYDLPSDEFSFDKKKITISESDYPEYVDGAYKKLFDMAYEMITDERYNDLSDEDKVRSFGEIKAYAQEAQRMEDVKGYELSGWEKAVYDGETKYMDSVLERKADRDYQDARDAYKKDFSYDSTEYSDAEIGVIDRVESDYASYKASIEQGRSYNESDLRHIKVYDEKLSETMTIEEYAGHRAEAKKTAAMADGKPSLKKDELKAYLDSTEYSKAVKTALFEAIGNKGWVNPYSGQKIQ